MQHLISPRTGRANVGTQRSSESKPAASGRGSSELPRRRGEALRGFFPKLAAWLEDAAQRARRNEIEEYLSQATDLADLEQRIRRIERRPNSFLC
jgi:hypothetical protein